MDFLRKDVYLNSAPLNKTLTSSKDCSYVERLCMKDLTTIQALYKGYGKLVAARLCQSLINEGIDVGLNVKSDNKAAISCYRKIGFEAVASYEEFMVQRKKDENNKG